MWRYRLRWYMQSKLRRRAGWGAGPKVPGFGVIAVFLVMLLAALSLLRAVWGIFMNGFLQSTPWVQGSQVGTYYWNSASFALKSTLSIGLIMMLITFLIGLQVSKFLKR